MAFPNDVHLTNGIPDTGTGNVNTINALMTQLATGPTPVSGTVTATLGAALPAGTNSIGTVQPGNTPNTVPWLVKLSDGTNSPAIKATAPVSGDMGVVVQINPKLTEYEWTKASSGSAPVALPTDAASVSVAFDTTQLMNGVSGAGLVPTKAKITATTAGTYTMVAAQTGKKIRLLSMYLNSTVANVINLQSHITTTNNDGHPAYSATGGMVLPFNPIGWFDSTVGEALDMVVGLNGEVSGQFSWIAV